MRRIIVFLITAMFIFASAGCLKKPLKNKPIKIAINIWPGYAVVFIAQEKGFFKKNNVEVELILKRYTPESRELFRRGGAEGCFDVFTDIIMLNSQGTPVKVVYIVDYSDSGDAIVGRPELNSLSDLKDKVVGCEGINTLSHLFVLKSLEKAGIKESDVRFENINGMDVLEALETNKISAGHTWNPEKSEALKKSYKVLGKAGDFPGIITDVLAFSPQAIQERPEGIKAIIKSLFEAREFVNTHRQEALRIMVKYEGGTLEDMQDGLNGVHQPDLKENIAAMQTTTITTVLSLYNIGKVISDFYLNRGQLSVIPDLNEVIEPKFVSELGKE